MLPRMTRRVLIVDDSELVRMSLARRVRALGLEVVEEGSAEAATKRSAIATDLACALLDLDLGDGFGTDVAERLRAHVQALPIAFFTSTTTGEALARMAAFGPVFLKPEELDRAIAWVEEQCVER